MNEIEMHVGAAIGKYAFREMQECMCSRACMHDKKYEVQLGGVQMDMHGCMCRRALRMHA